MADQPSFFAVSLGGRSALTPMDAAAEYLRARTSRVLPLYLVAMTPFSLVMLILIDVISSQNRSGLNEACLLLTLATIWRWLGLAWIQRRVQADLRGEPPLALRQRWLSYLLTRLFANFLLLWGGFLILPAFYGLYLSGIAAPALLESDRPSFRQVRDGLTWIHQAIGRLSKTASAAALVLFLLVIGALAMILFILNTVLSSMLGLNASDLSLTIGSLAGLMSIGYFLFVIFDLYWTVLSVMLFYDLQSRRLANDLRLRLRMMEARQT